MFQNNIKISTKNAIKNIKRPNNHHHLYQSTIHSIYIYNQTFALHSYHLNRKHLRNSSTYSYCTKRHFSILDKAPKIDDKKEDDDDIDKSSSKDTSSTSTTTTEENDEATSKAKHIEVHAFRSLITIAQEPDNLNVDELSLSFTERKAAKYQKEQQNKVYSESEETDNDNKWSPAIAYEIWHSPPEVYDRIYGFEADCEPPDRHNISWNWLYKFWGYYSEREVRYRCGLYTYMKAQRRCSCELFWEVFELENTFRVELQLLCLHLWFAKIRMIDGWGMSRGHKLCYKTFKVFFEQLPNRFGQHLSGSKSKWEQDCQQACLHFALSLDHAKEDYESGDKESYAKVIWNELYLSNRDIQHDLLQLWTKYIVQELNHLKHDVSDQEFLNGWWRFGKIPDVNDRIQIREDIIKQFEQEIDENDENDNK